MTAEKLKWAVVEDNGGGLHLYVLDSDDRCVWAYQNIEGVRGAGDGPLLLELIAQLAHGADPVRDRWENGAADPQAAWGVLDTSYREMDWEVIADDTGPCGSEYMGAAGLAMFYPGEARRE